MKALKLTNDSKNLLLAVYRDLGNWDNCSPGYNHIDAVSRGNLMDLKKKKLAQTFKDDGKEWITLTKEGKELASSLDSKPAKKAATKKGAAKKAPKAKTSTKKPDLKPASWLVARFRNALHKSQPATKEAKTLQGVSTLSDLKAALAMGREEWENLLESFSTWEGSWRRKPRAPKGLYTNAHRP